MSAEFDPYRKWLGIPEADRPPTHYQLLGLEPFENDLEVISHAADRQMAHVRTFQAGRYSAISQRVLNELATARVTLLNANKKRVYDDQLRATEQSQWRASELDDLAALDLAEPDPIAVFDPPMPVGQPRAIELPVEALSLGAGARRRQKRRRFDNLPLTVSLVVVAILLAVVALIIVADQWSSSSSTSTRPGSGSVLDETGRAAELKSTARGSER